MEDRFRHHRNLGYEDFRTLAGQPGISPHEKIGFPDRYRAGFTPAILADIRHKLPALDGENCTIVDIGPGCGELGNAIVEWAHARAHALWLIDGPEVLAALPGSATCHCVAGRFPEETGAALEPLRGQCDAVICYSVAQYILAEGNIHRFLDAALALLAPGGRLLVGDIPNDSMLRRFLASDAGRRYHREYSGRDEDPVAAFNTPSPDRFEDGCVTGLLLRARNAGFHAYVVPQPTNLPMSNRREDLLFIRP